MTFINHNAQYAIIRVALLQKLFLLVKRAGFEKYMRISTSCELPPPTFIPLPRFFMNCYVFMVIPSWHVLSIHALHLMITLFYDHSSSIWAHYNKIMCSQTVFPIWWKDLGRHRTTFVHTQHSAFHLDPQCVLVN